MPTGVPTPGRIHQSLPARATALGRSRIFPLMVALSAVVLALPALGAGWFLDDFLHRTILLEDARFRDQLGPPAEMFRFFRGDPVRTGRAMDIGIYPWWTDPTLKAEFLQALTVLTHRLDYILWPDSPAYMHAQSLFWMATAVFAVAVFYRRMLGATWVAAAASLLYAVDDARGTTVGFIANRNVLIAATFGVSALICHDRFSRGGSRMAALAAPLLLAAALFSKEEGIGTCAYLAAYGLFADPRGRWRGCLALLPYVVVVVVWRTLRASWGYGVHNMGLYVDPLTDPGPFLAAVVERAPIIFLGQWSPVPGETAIILHPPFLGLFWWAAVALAGLFFWVIAPLLLRVRLARFWAAGMIFATIPVCATLPMDRLLTFVGIGAFGLLAQFWEFMFDRSSGAPGSRWWRVPAMAMAWYLVVVQAVLAPLTFPVRAANPVGPRWVHERLLVRTPLSPSIGEKTLVIVNAPSPIHAGYILFLQLLSGQQVPQRTRVLAPAVPTVTIRRVDEHTLEIRPKGGYLDLALDRVFRNERRPMAEGQEVRLTGMTARVTAMTADGRPAVATFRFGEPLESSSYVWLCYRGKSYEPFVPPPVGEETRIVFDWGAVFTPPGLGQGESGSR
jgi:hypothetical protein